MTLIVIMMKVMILFYSLIQEFSMTVFTSVKMHMNAQKYDKYS